MKTQKKEFGKHYLVELIDCDAQTLKFVKDVKPAFLKAAQLSEATIIKHHFKQFPKQGVSGFIFIAESHFSIHTWPEYNYAGFDILTCGKMKPQKAINYLKKTFKAKKIKTKIIKRSI